MGSDMNSLASTIDLTLLKPDATLSQLDEVFAAAREHGFCSACVNPGIVRRAAEKLEGSETLVCSVIGFPLGATTTEAKAAETKQVVELGAGEVDMVMNLTLARSGEWEAVEADIAGVVAAAGEIPVKVILETCFLSDEEIVRACRACESAGAAFVKTSTGFGGGGATVEHIRLMRETVGDRLQVKASGGIRTPDDARTMLEAGADRLGIGFPAGLAIVQDQSAEGGSY